MSASQAPPLAESLRPLTQDPSQAAIFCDIDGTLAPIVSRPEDSHVREEVSVLLGGLGRRYAVVACVSGRSVAEARRLVGVGAIAYVGSHGAEVLRAGAKRPELLEAFAGWEGRVRDFVKGRENEREFKRLRIRLEDKGPIKAFHWRGSPDEPAAQEVLQGVAEEAEATGLDIHWGRKVLEVRPPVHVDKGQGLRTLVETSPVRAALYGGDDATDLDAFDALDELTAEGRLDAAVRVGVRSAEGPEAIITRADVVVEGVRGFTDVLVALAEAG
ncbi:MAG: trehalose-phosphatase [Actinomycetota bacterium]|nr:trehalose-phosphatase [Actinomycetota bacterium]